MATPSKSVIETLTALSSGGTTSEDCALAAIDRERECRDLNAIVSLHEGALLESARKRDDEARSSDQRGALQGVLFAAKDNIDVAGFPSTACTPALRENRPPRNAPVVQRLLDAGAVVFGKANMHELAFGITNNHGAFGPARNPHDPSLIPGGSSGGSAVAVASGIVPFALGTDTGGSSRIPAALCGIVGFRPSLGRYSQDGVVPISSTRDTIGPMATTVSDIALIDAVITGAQATLESIDLRAVRIGVPREYYYDDLEPAVAHAMESLLDALKAEGVTLVEERIPRIAELDAAVSFTLVNYETRRCLEHYLEQGGSGITFDAVLAQIASPDVKPVYEAVANLELVPEKAYREAVEVHRPALQRAFADYFASNRLDALLVPTCCLTARPIGHDETVELNGKQVPTFFSYVRNTDPSSNAGIPSLSIPTGRSAAGLPVGAMLEAPAGADRRLLAIALMIQARYSAGALSR